MLWAFFFAYVTAAYLFSACYDNSQRTYATLVDIAESRDLLSANRLSLSLALDNHDRLLAADKLVPARLAVSETPLRHTDRLRCSLPILESGAAVNFTFNFKGGFLQGPLPPLSPRKLNLYLTLTEHDAPFLPLRQFASFGLATIDAID